MDWRAYDASAPFGRLILVITEIIDFDFDGRQFWELRPD